MTMPADRERDRRSLQDLAKMAHGLTPPPSSVASAPSGVQRAAEAKTDDSGIVDLAAASQADPQAGFRAQTTPLASQGLFDDDSMRPPPMSAAPFGAYGQPMQPVPSVPPVPGSIPPASISQDSFASSPVVAHGAVQDSGARAVQPEKKKGGAVIALVLGGVVALSAAAAGGVFYVKSHKTSTVAKAPAATTAQPVIAQAEPPPAKVTPAPVAEPTPAAEPTMDPNALPAATPHGKVAVAPKAGGARVAAAPKPEAPAKAEGPAKMTEKDLVAAAPSGPAGDLGKAMQKEVGDEAAAKPAAATTGGNASAGNVPQKPSQGAVTGALGAVLPGARACLGPDDPISRASVVFGSAGTVQTVTVSGAAAGKPAEACIKTALMKAKVQAFAEPTYSANITIRHN